MACNGGATSGAAAAALSNLECQRFPEMDIETCQARNIKPAGDGIEALSAHIYIAFGIVIMHYACAAWSSLL
jgi:hypothetical protein